MATTKETREVEIIMNGKKVNSSIKEMEGAVAILNAQLKKLPQGTDEFVKKSEELKGVRQRLKDVKDDVYALEKASSDVAKSSGVSFGSLAGILAGGVLAAIGMVVAAVINFGKEAYELAKTYSDAFADIKKSTGMTNEEVQALNKSIGDLDTRTSQLDLLEIAKVGGQIGIAKEQMDGFVESTDKAVVALGDEFAGGAEEVAGTMGTLASLFKETKDLQAGDAINQIGSALNELGATGSATAPVVAEFAKRMGQLGDLSPQISQTLGLGAAFQELGLSAEISAGGLSNILLTAAKSTDVFAEHLGMTEQAFKDMINTDPNEVVLRLAASFKGLPVDVVTKRLDALGIKSQEATKVMSLLSNQTDKVREKQQLANKAMADGTSLTNEFNVKNNTDAAIAEKRAKAWEKLQLMFGQAIAPAISLVQDLLIGLFGVLSDVFNSLEPLFGDFFDVLGELGRSLGFTADKGSFLSGVFKAIGTVLNILLIPLKIALTVITALVGAFNYAYQSSAAFRLAIDAMLVPVKMLWTAIKEVIGWLGKLAEFGGKEVKVKASVETKTNNTTTNKTADPGKSDPSKSDPAGLNKLSSETEDERKAEEKERKKAERETKARERKEKADQKAKDDAIKQQKEFDEALIKAQNESAAAQLALSEKTNNDKLNKLNQTHQKEIDKLEEKRNAVLDNQKLTEEQKQALLLQYHNQEMALEQKFNLDKAEIEQENEEKLQQARNKRDLANAELDIARAGKNADLLLEAKLAKLEIEKDIELQNKELTEEEKALIEERYAARSEELYNEQAEKKKAKDKEIQNALVEFGRTAVDAISDFTKIGTDKKIAQYDREKTQAVKKLDEQLKQGAITKEQYDKAKEKTDAEYDKKTTDAKIKQAKIDKAVALTQAVISTALAVVKALPNVALSIIAGATGAIGIAKIAATPLPTFAEGGFTGPGFGEADESGFRPVGIVHEKEWVGPKWMTESPKYANVFGYLEAERKRAKGFADGGFTSEGSAAIQSSQPVSVSAGSVSNASTGSTDYLLLEVRAMREEMAAWPAKLKVINVVTETEDAIKMVNVLRNDAGI